MAYSPQDDGSLVIVASNGGSPTHPSWYHNLTAHPRIRVEVGAEMFAAVARELDGSERADMWPRLIETAPTVGAFQAQTARQIPLLALTRAD